MLDIQLLRSHIIDVANRLQNQVDTIDTSKMDMNNIEVRSYILVFPCSSLHSHHTFVSIEFMFFLPLFQYHLSSSRLGTFVHRLNGLGIRLGQLLLFRLDLKRRILFMIIVRLGF